VSARRDGGRTNPLARLGRLTGCLMTGSLVAASGVAVAATPIDVASSSPDVTIDVGGTVYADEDVAVDDLGGMSMAEDLGGLVPDSAVDAFHREYGGDRLFSLETTLSLPGSVVAGPEDVVRWDGSAYTLELDGTAEGVPSGVGIDAVSRDRDGELLVSFDVSVSLDGTTFADEDIASFSGGLFTMLMDGSAEGVDVALDLDGLHRYPWSRALAVSFDGSGSVGGVAFDDEDVVELATDGSWSLALDASGIDPDWSASDAQGLHLVPEPGLLVSLAAGSGVLGLLGRRRRPVARAAGRG